MKTKKAKQQIEDDKERRASKLKENLMHKAAVRGWDMEVVVDMLVKEVVERDDIIVQNKVIINELLVANNMKNLENQAIH